MRLDELLSDMLASGATLEQVRAVVAAHKFREDAKADARREKTTERVRRFRERKKRADRVTDVTDVTPVTSETRYDGAHLFSSEEEYPPSPPSGAQTPTGVRTKRAAPIADDWAPGEADREYARQAGLTEAELGEAAAEFLDFWRAEGGSKARKRDWSATWRNRIRALVERRKRFNGHHARAGPVREKRNPFIAAIEAELAEDLFRS